MARAFKAVAVALARAADEKKGAEIALFHPGPANPVADFILLASANSRPHLETLAKAVADAAEEFGLRPLRRSQSDQWRVLDFGGVAVHVMTEESRAFYALDKLYHGCRPLRWQARKTAHA